MLRSKIPVIASVVLLSILFLFLTKPSPSDHLITVKPSIIENNINLLVTNDFGNVEANLFSIHKDDFYPKAMRLLKNLNLENTSLEYIADSGYTASNKTSSLSIDNTQLALWQYDNNIKKCVGDDVNCYTHKTSKILSLSLVQEVINNTLGKEIIFDYAISEREKFLEIKAELIVQNASTPLEWVFSIATVDKKPTILSAAGFLGTIKTRFKVNTLNSQETATLLSARSPTKNSKPIKATYKRAMILVYDLDNNIWLAPGYYFYSNKDKYTEIALPLSVIKRI